MKKILYRFCFLLFFLFSATLIEAAGEMDTQDRGYFENTRAVLLLPTQYEERGVYGAHRLNQEMGEIFRYPYYRLLPVDSYERPIFPEQLSDLGKESGADIVVLPVVSQWNQWRFPRSIFSDADDILMIRVAVQVYSWSRKDGRLRKDQAWYSEQDEEGFIRNRFIMNEVMKKLFKTFPYRRVPIDRKAVLSG